VAARQHGLIIEKYYTGNPVWRTRRSADLETGWCVKADSGGRTNLFAGAKLAVLVVPTFALEKQSWAEKSFHSRPPKEAKF